MCFPGTAYSSCLLLSLLASDLNDSEEREREPERVVTVVVVVEVVVVVIAFTTER